MKINYCHLTAIDAIRKIQARELTVRKLTDSCLEQIKKIDSKIHAWVYLNPELALKQADVIDKKITKKNNIGILSGMPIGIKDIFNTYDMPTQMGSPIWKDFTPGNDARVVYYLRMADGVILGKTVTAEFAVHTPGPTANPHNPEYMPGTSSSGSAAAVASYMAPLAISTQTAGSTIRPASYCGVYGFKPSFGLIPRTGSLKTTDSLDTVGLFARTVDDLRLLFEVVRVHGENYPLSNLALNDVYRQNKSSNRPWRIALLRGPKWNNAEDYAQKAIYNFADKLRQLRKIVVEEVDLPTIFNEAHEVHSTIYDKTLAYYFEKEFKKHTLISRVMYQIIKHGNKITLDQYKDALERQNKIAKQLDSFFVNNYDILLNLSTGGEALKGLHSMDRPDNCLIWTLCGVPAINLPVFKGPTGLPFGAQVVARRYNDYLLLNFTNYLCQESVISEAPYPIPKLALQ